MNEPDFRLKLCICTEAKRASVLFHRNEQMQDAFNLLQSALPKTWIERKRLKYQFDPIDRSYGDPLREGLIAVTWGHDD